MFKCALSIGVSKTFKFYSKSLSESFSDKFGSSSSWNSPAVFSNEPDILEMVAAVSYFSGSRLCSGQIELEKDS